MRLGAIIVIGMSIIAISAKALPALPQSDDVRSLDAGYLEAAVFIDDSSRAMRQDAATESDSRAPLFGMETEPVAGGWQRNGAPSKPISIMNNRCWRAAVRRKPVPPSHKRCWIWLPKVPAARAAPVSA